MIPDELDGVDIEKNIYSLFLISFFHETFEGLSNVRVYAFFLMHIKHFIKLISGKLRDKCNEF